MSTNNEDEFYESNESYILNEDIMDLIFKRLDGATLFNVAAVCKSWRTAALHERNTRRYHIENVHLPHDFKNLASSLRVKPHVSLFVYDAKLERHYRNTSRKIIIPHGLETVIDHDLLDNFKDTVSRETIVLKVDECLTNGIATLPLTDQAHRLPTPEAMDHEILGLFLPSVEQRARVDVAQVNSRYLAHPSVSFRKREKGRRMLAERLAVDLHFDSCECPQSTIIFFTSQIRDFRILKKLGQRVERNGREIKVIPIYGRKLVSNYYETHHCSAPNNEHGFIYYKISNFVNSMLDRSPPLNQERMDDVQTSVVFKISGPSVESWSTFFFYSTNKAEVDRKLHELKEKVKPGKRHYTGLVCAPKCDYSVSSCRHESHPWIDSHKFMEMLSLTFPDIPFTGFFWSIPAFADVSFDDPGGGRFNKYDENNVFNDEFFETAHRHFGIIIISYD